MNQQNSNTAPFSSGQYLATLMQQHNLTNQDLADKTGIWVKCIDSIIEHDEIVGYKMAVMLEQIFSVSRDIWMDLDAKTMQYQADQHKKELEEDCKDDEPDSSIQPATTPKAPLISEEKLKELKDQVHQYADGILTDKGHHWPDYYNSKEFKEGKAKGVLEGAALMLGLVLKELNILQSSKHSID